MLHRVYSVHHLFITHLVLCFIFDYMYMCMKRKTLMDSVQKLYRMCYFYGIQLCSPFLSSMNIRNI